MNEDMARKAPDAAFRCQYDFTPRPDADVEAALRGDYDKPGDAGAGPMEGVRWIAGAPQRLR